MDKGAMKYINPWHIPGVNPPIYNRAGCKVYVSGCGRGKIVKVFDRWFDYLVDGVCVAQRAGKSMEVLETLIIDRDNE